MGTYEVIEVVQGDVLQPKMPWGKILFLTLGAAVITYYAFKADHEELLENSYRLLERLVEGPPEKATEKKRQQALRQLRTMERTGRVDSRLSDATKELALRVTELALPEFIEGVRVGTPSVVPGVPPVGAVLPIAEVLPREEWLGGKTLTWDKETGLVPIGEVELAATEDIQMFPPILEKVYDDFRAMTGEVDFENWVEDQYGMNKEAIVEQGLLTKAYQDYSEWLGEKLQEDLYEFMWDRNRSQDYNIYKYELFATTEMDRYATTHASLAITNEETNRTYVVHDLFDLFYGKLREDAPFTEDDINYSTMYLWDAPPDQNKVDREIKRALSQYLSLSLLPGQYARLHREWWIGEAGCEAYECYKPPRTIMDPNLQIMKAEGEADEITECPANVYGYAYSSDYCWAFAKTLQLATEDEMTGTTWGRSSWFVDICGLHVEVDGQYYTIPADNMLEYMMGQYNVPKYLEGLVCAAFAVVTPGMQKELEEEVIGKKILTKEEILDKEMPLLIEVIRENVIYNLGATGLVEYVEIYARDGWSEALRWLVSSASEIPTEGTYGDDVDWSIDDNGHFHLTWSVGKSVGRGSYVVSQKFFARYLLDVGKGRSRRSIHYELA